MSSDARNTVVIAAGLVADPELIDAKGYKIAKLRVAVDYAGSSQNDDKNSGYFDVTYFLNDDNPNAKFVRSQIEQKNFKPGSSLLISGRLVQERWEKDGEKRSKVVIMAENITYAGNAARTEGDAARTTSESAPLPPNF